MSFLKNVDATVRSDVRYIALVVLILTALMESVFLVIGQWNITVLFGGLLGALTAILNFFLMAMSVVKAVGKEQKDANSTMKVSHSMRMLMLVVVCAIAALLPQVFNLVSVIVPLLFPSVGARLHGVLMKNKA